MAARTLGGACRGQTADANDMVKLIAVFPQGGKAAEDPNYVCCEENGLGIKDLLRDRADVFITSDKEGPDSGTQLACYLRLMLMLSTSAAASLFWPPGVFQEYDWQLISQRTTFVNCCHELCG